MTKVARECKTACSPDSDGREGVVETIERELMRVEDDYCEVRGHHHHAQHGNGQHVHHHQGAVCFLSGIFAIYFSEQLRMRVCLILAWLGC